MITFNWKLSSFAKGISPDSAEVEFKKIEKKYGKLTTETVLESARSRKSLFHSLFEWEDSKAAEQYRLQQARTIINNIDSLTFNEVEYVKEQTLKTLIASKTKLANYNVFNKVIAHIQEAVKELEEIV